MDLISQKMREGLDQPLLVGAGKFVLTKGEAYEKADKIARAMLDHGLRKGDRVLITLGSTPETVITEMACALAGFAYMPFAKHDNLTAYMSTLYEAVDAKYVVNPAIFDFLLNRAAKVGKIEDHPKDTDVLMIRRTSGTMGMGVNADGQAAPGKLVPVRRGKSILGAQLLQDYFPAHGPKMTVGFTAGFYNPNMLYHSLIYPNSPLVYFDAAEATPDDVIKVIAEVRPDRFTHMKFDHGKKFPDERMMHIFRNGDLSSIGQYAICSIIQNDVMYELQDLQPDLPLCRMSGQSEIVYRFACLNDDPRDKKLTTFGRLARYGDTVKLDANGEMLVHKDYALEYFDPALNRLDDDAWFRTGDSYDLDDDGYLTNLGRIHPK